MNRPGHGWSHLFISQGDSNRSEGTPESRYRQRTFLYKGYIAVFGGGRHQEPTHKLDEVYFFDLRKADKLQRARKEVKAKDVWIKRSFVYDDNDPAYEDIKYGRIHFSIAPQINGPRAYIAGGLAVLPNGEEKLTDSIYEFNVHANNGQQYRDDENRLLKFKKARINWRIM